jgi:hypothetical protein
MAVELRRWLLAAQLLLALTVLPLKARPAERCVDSMMASRGMGDIAPSKMPKGKKKARRDDTDFTQYKEGGKVKAKYMKFSETGKPIGMEPVTKAKEGGKVNAAGNYTKPSLRKKIVSQVKAAATQGTGAGQWSARKAQLVAKKYKAAGGGYRD